MPNVKIKLEKKTGNIDRFNAWVSGKKVIGANQSEAPEWSGEATLDQDGCVKITVQAYGNADAKYKITFTRSPMVSDQSMEIQLLNGKSYVSIKL